MMEFRVIFLILNVKCLLRGEAQEEANGA